MNAREIQSTPHPPLFVEPVLVPSDAPQRMREQAELQELRYAVKMMYAQHQSCIKPCPCGFCNNVRKWVA